MNKDAHRLDTSGKTTGESRKRRGKYRAIRRGTAKKKGSGEGETKAKGRRKAEGRQAECRRGAGRRLGEGRRKAGGREAASRRQSRRQRGGDTQQAEKQKATAMHASEVFSRGHQERLSNHSGARWPRLQLKWCPPEQHHARGE